MEQQIKCYKLYVTFKTSPTEYYIPAFTLLHKLDIQVHPKNAVSCCGLYWRCVWCNNKVGHGALAASLYLTSHSSQFVIFQHDFFLFRWQNLLKMSASPSNNKLVHFPQGRVNPHSTMETCAWNYFNAVICWISLYLNTCSSLNTCRVGTSHEICML